MGWMDSHIFCVREARTLTKGSRNAGWAPQFTDEAQTAMVTAGMTKAFTHVFTAMGIA